MPDIIYVYKRWKNKRITEATKTCKLCSMQILVFNMHIGFELVLTTMNKFLHKNCYRKAFAHLTEVPAHCDRLYIQGSRFFIICHIHNHTSIISSEMQVELKKNTALILLLLIFHSSKNIACTCTLCCLHSPRVPPPVF